MKYGNQFQKFYWTFKITLRVVQSHEKIQDNVNEGSHGRNYFSGMKNDSYFPSAEFFYILSGFKQ